MLRHNTSLTRLNLKKNNISTSGMKEIFNALLTNTTLTSLNLGYNCVRRDYIGVDVSLENTGPIQSLITRNINYNKVKANLKMCFNIFNIPNELYYTINNFVLLLCI